MGEYVWLAPLVAFLVPAIGWGFREYWQRRNAKRLATEDATKTLQQKKVLLEEIIAEAEDPNDKNNITAQLDEVNAALLGLYGERLRHTLKEAGLPAEKKLIANGRSRLQPQQVARLERVVAQVKVLPPSLSTQDLLVLGNAYYYMEQYQDAKNIYDKILNLNPNDPSALTNRGITCGRLKRYDEALTDLNRSLELRPDDPETLMNRGVTYDDLERYEDALADYNRSLELKPDDSHTLANQGLTCGRLKRYDEALADFNRSLELRPNHPDTLTNR